MNQANATLAQVIRSAIDRGLAELRVSCVGRIERFDPVLQVADVKPLQKDSVEGENGQEIVDSIAVIPSVPVQFPGGGGYAETWPVAKGDLCTLVFTDRSLDRWFASGGEVDPVDLARHALTSAVAYLGVRDSQAVLMEFDTARAVWGNKGPRVAADGTVLHIGVAHNEVATQDVVRGKAFLDALDQFLTSLEAQTSAAGSALSTAGGSLTTAASLNAVPVYGGSLASPAFGVAAGAISAAGGAVSAIQTAVDTFKALWATLSTPKVKTP